MPPTTNLPDGPTDSLTEPASSPASAPDQTPAPDGQSAPEPATLTARERVVLDSLVTRARPIILSEFQADSCIASTRIGLDVLDFFGIPAHEIAVRIAVFNAEAVDLLRQGVPMPDLAQQVKAIPASTPGGPWSLGIGAENPNRSDGLGWPGHLVIAMPGPRVLVDLSVDQAARPHKNLPLAPFWTVADDPQWWAKEPIGAVTDAPGGGLMIWSRDPQGGDRYRESTNWHRRSVRHGPGLFKRLTGQIIRRVREDLASHGYA